MSVMAPPRPTTGETSPEARGAAVVATLALIATVLIAPPWGGSSLPRGQVARIQDGVVEVADGDTWQARAAGDFIAVGSRVRAPDEAATLAVQGGTYALARGTDVTLHDARFHLTTGRLLADVDRVVIGRFAGVQAEGRGTWRFDVGLDPRVAVYDGGVGVELEGADRSVPVAELEQVALIDDAPEDRATPIRYVRTDPWDARLLAEAIAIDQQAGQLRTGLAAQYGSAPRPLDFYEDFAAVDTAVLRALPRVGVASSEGFGPPADVLLAIVVVDLVARSSALSRDQAVEDVLGLRREGASYGLVLRHHDLSAQDLVDAVAVALNRRAREVAQGPAGGDPSPSEEPSPTPSPTESPSPRPTPSPTDEPSPEPPPSPDPVDEIVDLLPDPVQEPVDELTDLLRDVVDDLPLPG